MPTTEMLNIRSTLRGCLLELDRIGMTLPAARLSEVLDTIDNALGGSPQETAVYSEPHQQWGRA